MQPTASRPVMIWHGAQDVLEHILGLSGIRRAFLVASLLIVLVLALYRLQEFPLTWFDEGSHLHVPKALVQFGVYADYSSEGFRYFGPSNGVGPTVLLPIAGAFSLFGIGLTQARAVMAIYLVAAVVVFYLLGKLLGGSRLAWVATAMLVASRGAPLLEYGRQVVGEVPALFFLVSGLLVWFGGMDRPSLRKELIAGGLFGLAMVTKQQELLVIAPMLAAGWLADHFYYRQTGHRFFVLPGLVALAVYLAWQATLLFFLAPSSFADNLRMFRDSVGGAALVFSPTLVERAIRELLDAKVYLGALVPSVVYACIAARQRTKSSFRWFLLLALLIGNLGWYVMASLSWARYAFPGLAIGALFIANFLSRWTDDFHPLGRREPSGAERKPPALTDAPLRWAGVGWLAIIICLPLAQTVADIASPPPQTPAAIANYIDDHIPSTAIIETWEPEVGFLSNRTFHYPPPSLLNKAVAYIWLGGPSPSLSYTFVQTEHPDYLLVGEFGRWVDMYPPDIVDSGYTLMTEIGSYDLYQRR